MRINPGQLSQIPGATGVQAKFDDLMNSLLAKGKLVWSSPGVQTQMGAKDALVMIKELNCGLVDTFAYYDAKELEEGFKKTCAFQPRVIKQNRGSAGEGIWLVWLDSGKYPCEELRRRVARRRRQAQADGDERQPRRVPHRRRVPHVLR